MNFTAIKPDQVETIWPHINHGMEKLLKQSQGLWSADQIRDQCIDGQWMLFCMFEDKQSIANLVVEIRDGQQRIFDVGFCWGTNIDDWIEDVCASFTQIARECGCDAVAFNGRPGWRKLAKEFGFSIKSMIYAKELSYGRG